MNTRKQTWKIEPTPWRPDDPFVFLSIGLVMATIWFTGDTVQRVDYLLVSKVQVSGWNPRRPCAARAWSVGKVEDIDFDPKDPRTILVRIAVDSAAPITKGTYAQFAYLGVTGLSYVQLDDDGSKPEPLPTSAAAPAHIEVRPSLFDQVGASGQQLLADAGEAAKRVNVLLSEHNLVQFSQPLPTWSRHLGASLYSPKICGQPRARLACTRGPDRSHDATGRLVVRQP